MLLLLLKMMVGGGRGAEGNDLCPVRPVEVPPRFGFGANVGTGTAAATAMAPSPEAMGGLGPACLPADGSRETSAVRFPTSASPRASGGPLFLLRRLLSPSCKASGGSRPAATCSSISCCGAQYGGGEGGGSLRPSVCGRGEPRGGEGLKEKWSLGLANICTSQGLSLMATVHNNTF